MLYYGLLIFVQILFGLNFVASKIVVTTWSSVGFAAWRFIISGIILLIYLKLRKRDIKLDPKHWPMLLGLSIVGLSISQSAFLWGLKHTTATNTSLLSSTIPVFVFIINRARKIGHWTRLKAIGLMLSFGGVLILRNIEDFRLSNESFVGDLFVLAACASLGALISYSRDFYQKVEPLVGSSYMFIVGGALLLPAWFISGAQIPSWNFQFNMALGYSIIGATCLTYVLNNIILQKVDSDIVGLFIFLQPVVATIFSTSFLGEEFTVRMAGSFGLIALGVLCVIAKGSPRPQSVLSKAP